MPELAVPLGLSAAEICDGLDAAAEALMEAELVGMPHARAAVERVAAGDRRVGLASSSTRAFIDRVLQTLGIAERFATIVSGDEVARGKPYPEIYRASCVSPRGSPAALRGDRGHQTGVSAAASAGMTTIAVPNRYSIATELAQADAIVSDLDEAAALILTLDTS